MDPNHYPPSYEPAPAYEPPPSYEPPSSYGYPAPGTIPATQPGTYPQAYLGYPPMAPVIPHTSTLAIVSLVSSLLGVTVIPGIGSIVGVICGHLALSEIKQSNGQVEGQGLAIAGLVTGYITLGLALVICLCIVALFASALGQQ